MNDQASKLRRLVVNKGKEKTFKLISLVSTEMGVGQTQVAVNLAGKLHSNMEKPTLVIDLKHKGNMPADELEDLEDKLYSKGFMKDSVMLNEDGVHILPVSINYERIASLGEEERENILRSSYMFENYDYVIIDTITGIDKMTTDIMKLSNEIIVVFSESDSNIFETYKLIKKVCTSSCNDNIYFIMNKVRDFDISEDTCKNLFNTVDNFLQVKISSLGYLRYVDLLKGRDDLKTATVLRYPDSQFSKDLQVVANRIDRQERLGHYNRNTFRKKLLDVFK